MFNSVKKFILKDIVLEIKDIRSLQHLRTVHSEYVPWTGASIHPTALLYLLNDITIHKRKHVVECGSGISTIYISSLIKQLSQNITFHSIDHDENWLSVVQNNLKKHNLENFVDLIHAPLIGQNNDFIREGTWYDTSVLNKRINGNKIDLLFIDGPPANKNNHSYARYPAVPYFKPKLSDHFAIILDDACRKGEQLIAEKWKQEYGLSFTECILKGNISIASRGNRYNVL